MKALSNSKLEITGNDLLKFVEDYFRSEPNIDRNAVDNYPSVLYGVISTLPSNEQISVINKYMDNETSAIKLKCIGLVGRKVDLTVNPIIFETLEKMICESINLYKFRKSNDKFCLFCIW